MDLDQIITKVEQDLAALRRAREVARRYGGDTANAKQEAPTGAWFEELPEMLHDESLSIRQIERALKAKGFTTAYSTIYTWMGRAVDRNEYVRKGSKYRYKGLSASMSANGTGKEAAT